MFWITTATAVVFALLFRTPAVVAIPLILFINVALLPAVWTTVIVYGRGYQRTFCIGAIFPSTILLLLALFTVLDHGTAFYRWNSPWNSPEEDFWFRIVVFTFWLSSLLVGLVCMGVRRLVETRPNLRKRKN